MKSLLIKDLSALEELDRESLRAVRGGVLPGGCYGPSPFPGVPWVPGTPALPSMPDLSKLLDPSKYPPGPAGPCGPQTTSLVA